VKLAAPPPSSVTEKIFEDCRKAFIKSPVSSSQNYSDTDICHPGNFASSSCKVMLERFDPGLALPCIG
jgi:hypothetical protein